MSNTAHQCQNKGVAEQNSYHGALNKIAAKCGEWTWTTSTQYLGVQAENARVDYKTEPEGLLKQKQPEQAATEAIVQTRLGFSACFTSHDAVHWTHSQRH